MICALAQMNPIRGTYRVMQWIDTPLGLDGHMF
jgi:hypothetical protein